MKNRGLIVAGVVALLAVVIVLVLWKRGESTAIEPERLANDIASGKTITLPDGAKVLGHSPAADYFALPDVAQRTAFLDKMIDQQEATQKKIASGEIKMPQFAPSTKATAATAETDDKGQTTVKHESSADGKEHRLMIRMNADDLSPALRAQMEEFHAALRNRRKERGLDPDAPFMFIKQEVRTSK